MSGTDIPLLLISLFIGYRNIPDTDKIKGKYSIVAFILFSISLCFFFYSTDKLKAGINEQELIILTGSVVLIILAFIVIASRLVVTLA
ncbi:MAG: hypothetical protein ACWIPH_09645 [Ostreibacterium sp.]